MFWHLGYLIIMTGIFVSTLMHTAPRFVRRPTSVAVFLIFFASVIYGFILVLTAVGWVNLILLRGQLHA